MKITLYHGSTLSIEHPLAKVGRADLDFGRGFYLTSLRSQAERWATRVQLLRASTTAWINVYAVSYTHLRLPIKWNWKKAAAKTS